MRRDRDLSCYLITALTSIPRCPGTDRIRRVIHCFFVERQWVSTIVSPDALLLLERGADSNRAGADGVTFGNMLMAHRAHFQQTLKPPPTEFATLWDWAEKRGIVQRIH